MVVKDIDGLENGFSKTPSLCALLERKRELTALRCLDTVFLAPKDLDTLHGLQCVVTVPGC